MNWAIYAMVYLGSALMVYNITGFIRFARHIQKKKDWGRERSILYIPIVLLVLFLLGYLAVGLFGDPDLIVSGILFGGSIFVFIIFKLLWHIADRIQENEQMAGKLLAAEASSQAKSSFLASMSHEMRTPMNAIIGLDTIALRDDTLAPQTRDRLEKIGISARHMMDLINNVLEMNHMESGEMVLGNEPFSPGEIIELLNLLIQTQCGEAGLTYKTGVTGSIDDTCIGDGLRLKQALLGLLENAVKFTPAPGTVTFLTERLPAGENQCVLRFTISDTGIGMDEAFIHRAFESFSQEDASTTNRFGGSGLGLAITRRIIDLMHGDIAVKSRKGEGSTFEVTVPLDCAAKAVPEEAAPAAPEPVDLSGRRILVAEDIDINAEIVCDLLELRDIDSERARDGQEALDMFSRNPPGYYDAILMDLRMPVMDGLDATRRIRALDRPDARTIPIAALTANAFEEDVQRSLEAGMDVHLSKPVDAELLYETLEKLLTK